MRNINVEISEKSFHQIVRVETIDVQKKNIYFITQIFSPALCTTPRPSIYSVYILLLLLKLVFIVKQKEEMQQQNEITNNTCKKRAFLWKNNQINLNVYLYLLNEMFNFSIK